MAQFSAQQGGTFTPVAHATNANNWTLEADTAGDIGKVKMFGWGGRGTTSTGYRTRWGRPSTNGTSTFTSLVPTANNPSAASLCRCGTFATASILAADPAALWAQDWNVLGGGGVIVLPIGGEWMVAGVAAPYAQVSCGNIAGADANLSSYGVTWEE
jgi:hypothetical protein